MWQATQMMEELYSVGYRGLFKMTLQAIYSDLTLKNLENEITIIKSSKDIEAIKRLSSKYWSGDVGSAQIENFKTLKQILQECHSSGVFCFMAKDCNRISVTPSPIIELFTSEQVFVRALFVLCLCPIAYYTLYTKQVLEFLKVHLTFLGKLQKALHRMQKKHPKKLFKKLSKCLDFLLDKMRIGMRSTMHQYYFCYDQHLSQKDRTEVDMNDMNFFSQVFQRYFRYELLIKEIQSYLLKRFEIFETYYGESYEKEIQELEALVASFNFQIRDLNVSQKERVSELREKHDRLEQKTRELKADLKIGWWRKWFVESEEDKLRREQVVAFTKQLERLREHESKVISEEVNAECSVLEDPPKLLKQKSTFLLDSEDSEF